MSSQSQELRVGDKIGSYEVVAFLGKGGMGEVYGVRHEVLGTHFALKILSQELMESESAMARIQREGEVMARLDHPGIVRVDDSGFLPREELGSAKHLAGRPFLRMEWIHGNEAIAADSGDTAAPSIDSDETRIEAIDPREELRGSNSLESWVADHRKKGEALPEPTVRLFLRQILEALQYAHKEGVVHRDLKPANILVAGDEMDFQAKITDFGLVRLVGEDWIRSRVELSVARSLSIGSDKTVGAGSGSDEATSTRALLGTFAYMAPEQKRGEPADERADLYAVGLMAYQLLTGSEGLSLKPPSRIREGINPDWDLWVEKATEPDKEDRFANSSEMLAALPSPTFRRKNRRPALLGVAAALVVLGIAVFTATIWKPWEVPPAPIKPPPIIDPDDDTFGGQTKPLDEETPDPGIFLLRVDPAGVAAKLQISGEANPRTIRNGRIELEDLAPGTHEFSVTAAGYRDWFSRVEVDENGSGSSIARLVPIRGDLRLSSDPGVAVTAIDQYDRSFALGTTGADGSLTLDRRLLIGDYTLRLEKSDYASVEIPANISENRTATLEAFLDPLPGLIRVVGDLPGAVVSLNDQRVGSAPIRISNVQAFTPQFLTIETPEKGKSRQLIALGAAEDRVITLGEIEFNNTLICSAEDRDRLRRKQFRPADQPKIDQFRAALVEATRDWRNGDWQRLVTDFDKLKKSFREIQSIDNKELDSLLEIANAIYAREQIDQTLIAPGSFPDFDGWLAERRKQLDAANLDRYLVEAPTRQLDQLNSNAEAIRKKLESGILPGASDWAPFTQLGLQFTDLRSQEADLKKFADSVQGLSARISTIDPDKLREELGQLFPPSFVESGSDLQTLHQLRLDLAQYDQLTDEFNAMRDADSTSDLKALLKKSSADLEKNQSLVRKMVNQLEDPWEKTAITLINKKPDPAQFIDWIRSSRTSFGPSLFPPLYDHFLEEGGAAFLFQCLSATQGVQFSDSPVNKIQTFKNSLDDLGLAKNPTKETKAWLDQYSTLQKGLTALATANQDESTSNYDKAVRELNTAESAFRALERTADLAGIPGQQAVLEKKIFTQKATAEVRNKYNDIGAYNELGFWKKRSMRSWADDIEKEVKEKGYPSASFRSALSDLRVRIEYEKPSAPLFSAPDDTILF